MTENTTGFHPAGNYVLVKVDPVDERTKGGVILPSSTADAAQFETETGEIIEVGPATFGGYSDNFGDGEMYGPGMRVMFTKFSGRVVKTNDGCRWIALKDDAIVGWYNG